MSWFEAFICSVLVIGLGVGFIWFIVRAFVAGATDDSPKASRIVNWIMTTIMIIGVFLFIPVVQYGSRNVGKEESYSHSSKREYSSDSDWGNYDYDDDGKINQNEWENALGDYMDEVMP